MSHLASRNMRLECKSFQGTPYHDDIVILACTNYGHLIRTVAESKTTFAEFAEVIEQHYDMANLQNREVVHVLREVERLNPATH